jgi:hypothetical protein
MSRVAVKMTPEFGHLRSKFCAYLVGLILVELDILPPADVWGDIGLNGLMG